MANLFTDFRRHASSDYTQARSLLSSKNIRKSLRGDLTSLFLQHAFGTSSQIFVRAAVRAPVFIKTRTEESS